jgi:hypothetical protein
MRMGNLLAIDHERSSEMATRDTRLGIDHPTVVPGPAPSATRTTDEEGVDENEDEEEAPTEDEERAGRVQDEGRDRGT